MDVWLFQQSLGDRTSVFDGGDAPLPAHLEWPHLEAIESPAAQGTPFSRRMVAGLTRIRDRFQRSDTVVQPLEREDAAA